MADIRLPSGYLVRDVPDDVSNDELRATAIKNGWASESDFGAATAPQEQELPTYSMPDNPNIVPVLGTKDDYEAEKERMQMLKIPGVKDDDLLYQAPKGRAGTIGVAAMTGAELGRKVAGPDPRMQVAGAAIGGAIGAFGGSYGFDRTLGGKPPQEAALDALREAELDASFGVGIPILANYAKVLGPLAMRAMGIDAQKAQYLLSTAAEVEAKIGIVDVAKNNFVKGTKTVIGVFPWIGTPYREASKISAEAIEKNINNTLNRVAPNASLSSIGVDMTKGAENSFGSWKRTAGGLFDTADDYARSVNAQVPAQSMIQTAKNIGRRKDFPDLTKGGFKDAAGNPITEYIENVTKIAKESLSVDELRALETGLDELWTHEISAVDGRRIMLMKEGFEKAWGEIGDPAAREMYDFAKGFYADGMTKFSSTTAKRLGRVDMRIFKAGKFKAGSLNEDEVASAVFNLKSPQAVKDLKDLVGQEQVHRAFRNKIDIAIEGAIKRSKDGVVESFDWSKMEAALGLTGNKVELEALEETLKGTGVSIGDFTQVIRLGKAITKAPDASQFVARRTVMGGKGALLGSFGVGALTGGVTGGIPGGVVGAVIPAMMARRGATLLTRPETLKNLLYTLTPAIKPASKRVAMARLIKADMEMEEEEQ